MTYHQTEKEQLVKYAKTAISLFSLTEQDVRVLSSVSKSTHESIASFCFNLAEAMIEEQRKRFGS